MDTFFSNFVDNRGLSILLITKQNINSKRILFDTFETRSDIYIERGGGRGRYRACNTRDKGYEHKNIEKIHKFAVTIRSLTANPRDRCSTDARRYGRTHARKAYITSEKPSSPICCDVSRIP